MGGGVRPPVINPEPKTMKLCMNMVLHKTFKKILYISYIAIYISYIAIYISYIAISIQSFKEIFSVCFILVN